MAHRKAGGSTDLGRDSKPKYLGVKIFGGQKVQKGQIIVRQRGTKFKAGEGTKRAGDDSIISLKDGAVKFITKKLTKFTGKLKNTKIIEVR
ncbi:MAG: 50S ribosomal protein L27 [Patescibacteria group bacterium]|nr:50S ribosomal protein L27 [Patescibacteria group bacterium]